MSNDQEARQKQEALGRTDDSGVSERPRIPLHKRPVVRVVAVVLLAGVITAVVYWLYGRRWESTDDAFIDVHEVAVVPKVAGYVLRLGEGVGDNTPVKKGQILLEIDPRDYQAAWEQADAAAKSAQSRSEQAKAQRAVYQANVTEAEAEVKVAQAAADNAQEDLKRIQSVSVEARSQERLDAATAAAKSTDATVAQAEAHLKAAHAQVSNQDVAVQVAEHDAGSALAALKAAQNNLDYCTIAAATDGRVTGLSVQPGSFVSSGQVLFAVVPTDVWVTANFKETQLDEMRPGQAVQIEVDAFGGQTFSGKVDSIQAGTGARFSLLPPENATGNYVKVVQRVPVKIVFDPPLPQAGDPAAPRLLSPGMSVVPSVKVR